MKDRKIVIGGISFLFTNTTAEFMFGCYPLSNKIFIEHLINNCKSTGCFRSGLGQRMTKRIYKNARRQMATKEMFQQKLDNVY